VIVAIPIVIIVFDTLEDTLIEGSSFTGTPLDVLFNAVLQLTQNVTATVSSWGYAGVFLLMLLESSSLPVPSEVVLPFSGYLVSLGQLNMWITVLVSTVAGVMGSLVDYYVGLKGVSMLARRRVLDRLFFDKARLETAEAWFNKYGAAAVFLSRMIPGFRTLVSFPAGAVRMPLRKFVACTTAGCLIWNAFLIYIGFYIGANWREVAGVSRYLIVLALAAVLVALIVFLARRRNSAMSEPVE
jgi:membrane protein DedA with SNARE-associated domain